MVTLRDFGTDFYRRNPGATDEELVGLMNSYNKHAPSYDYEQGKSLPGNDKKFRILLHLKHCRLIVTMEILILIRNHHQKTITNRS